METAPHLVVDAPGGHPIERPRRHLQRPRVGAKPATKDEFQSHRLRELRGSTEAAPRPVERPLEPGEGLPKEVR